MIFSIFYSLLKLIFFTKIECVLEKGRAGQKEIFVMVFPQGQPADTWNCVQKQQFVLSGCINRAKLFFENQFVNV